MSVFTRMEAIRRGFRAVFGEADIGLGYHLAFYPPSGANNRDPLTISRTFCVSDGDLETVDDLVARVARLRTTFEGRYLYRVTDLDRLQAAAAAPERVGGEAGCT